MIGAVGGALVSTTSYLMNTSSGDITIGGVLTAAGVGVALTSAVSAGYTYATTEGSTGERLACTVVFVAFAGGSAGNALGNIVANNVSTGAGFVLGTAFGSYIAGETMDCFSVGVQYCIKSIRK